MSGWGVMLALATSFGGGLVFLSIVSDDLQRANTHLENQRFRMQEKRKERLRYEAAVRKAEAREKKRASQSSVE